MNDNLSQKQLKQINYQLKCENEVLKTDLITIKILLNSYEKYFNEINETIASNKEVLDLKKNIKVLKECRKSCFVSLKPLNENQLNHLCQPIVDTKDVWTQTQYNNELQTTSQKWKQIQTERENKESTHRLSAEEVSDNNSNGSNNWENQSNDGISGSVDQNSDQMENNINSNEELNDKKSQLKNIFIKKEIIYETNSNELNEDLNQIRIENIRSLRTKPINSELEDNEIKTEDNSDTDCDFVVDEQQMSDSSEDESIRSNDLKTDKNIRKNKSSENEKYFCDYIGCHKQYTRSDILRRHKKLHSGIQYACDRKDCNKVFNAKRYLRKHLITFHNKSSKKGKYFDEQQSDHLIQQLVNGMYVCDHIGCGKQFNTKRQIYSHKRIHSGQQFKCEWKDCTKIFNVKRYLERHMKKHKGIYRCTYEGCPYNAVDANNLKIHEMSHSDDKHIKCLINDCNKGFKNMIQLRRHHLVAHPQEFDDIPWFKCKEKDCDFKTKSKLDLGKHTKSHTRPYVCKVCKKSFSGSNALKRHLEIHSSIEERVSCDWPGCDRLFLNKSLLKDHMNMHTAAKTFSCIWPNCDKTFLIQKSLNQHTLRHKGKGRQNCPHCDYGSTNNIRYKSHLKKHENQTK